MLSYKPTLAQVQEAIRLHALWLEDKPGGTGASFIGCNLIGINLEGAILDYAHLEGAVLVGAKLAGVSLRHAWLTGADLSGADLTRVTMESAGCAFLNLTGAITEGLDLTDAFTRGIITDDPVLQRRLSLVSPPRTIAVGGYKITEGRVVALHN